MTGDVGAYYDLLTPLLQRLWGGNLHIGLWPGDGAPRCGGADAVTEAGDRVTDLLVHRLAPRAADRVLDIGCGTGRPALRLARATGARVTGVTISTSQVRLATAAAEEAGLSHRVRFHHADAVHLPFGDRSHTAAWAIESLLHIPGVPRALAEVRRVLVPGGPFVISDMILRSADAGRHEHSTIRSLTTLLAQLDDAGFAVRAVTDLDPHLRRSLNRLATDLDTDRLRLLDTHGPRAVDALARVLRKTIPGIGTVFGYVVITAEARDQGDHHAHP